jgi:hypothetical protein
MKSLIKTILLLLIIGISFPSCFKIETYPPEPKIEFIEFRYTDTTILGNPILAGLLRFSFVDGDGNIGFGLDTTLPKTVFVDKYKIENGEVKLIELNEDIINFRIPQFATSGDRKPLKGEIIIKSLDELLPINYNDTLMYKFYIVDRSLNKSNIDSTGYLILKNYIK